MSTFVAAPFPSSLSLVEYRKVCSNTLSRSFQSKRRSICGLQYTSTALMTINRHNFDPTVYLVTDRRTKGEAAVEDVVRTALLGNGAGQGVTFVQLRDKNVSREYSINLGKQLRRLTIETNTAFVINDDISLARELGADGVHLGQDDESVAIARQALGEDAIIGVSAGTPEEAGKAIEDGADYLGVGAIFATASKADAGEPIGVAGLRQIVERVNGRIPVVAIGGIGLQNAKQCRMAGADGVAVVSAIMGSHEPDIVASSLHAILGESIDI